MSNRSTRVVHSVGRDERAPVSLRAVVLKSLVAHTATYFVVGFFASSWFEYERWFAESRLSCFMRPLSDTMVMAGPLFQPLRGALFGAVIYVLREPCLYRPHAWARLWFVLTALGIVNTFGATGGSIEGLVYTTLPWRDHLRGLPEVFIQSLLLSWVVVHWANARQPRGWHWVLGITFVVAMALPILGLLLGVA